MRKRDKLYTVNRWNNPLLCSGGKLFDIGGFVDTATSKLHTTTGAVDKVAGIAGGLINKGISGKYSSGAGKAITGIGESVGDALGPGIGTAVKLGANVIGGVTNALFGTNTNQEALNQANATISAGNGFTSTAGSFDDIKGPVAQQNFLKVYSGGALKKGWARKKNAALKAQVADANSFAQRSVENNVSNIADDQMGNALASYAAYGGPLAMMNNDMGATEYGMMSDYLTIKSNQAQNKNSMVGYLGGTGTPTMFALGGDIQSNGADWSTGLGHIAAGGTHEDNPYQGVQMGIAPDGQPNLVEEGETIYNDYVFSDRIKPTKEVLKKFHLSAKNSKMTYADVSKKLEKESLERPNDPLSQAAFHKMLDQLAEAQEQQKAAEAAREAQAAFAAMSPEEQQQVMAQIAAQAQQEQLAQQQAAYDQQQAAEQEVPVDENGNPVDPSMMQQGYACGGRLHKFAGGGRAKLLKMLGLNFGSDLNKWAEDNKVGYMSGDEFVPFDIASADDENFANLLANQSFIDAINKTDPKLADALARHYDFGNRTFDAKKHAVYSSSMNSGNFKAWDGKNFRNGVLGWSGVKNGKVYDNQSTDPIWTQALSTYMTQNNFKKGQETEAIDHLLANGNIESFQNLMAGTQAYKDTTKLLQDNEDLRKQYYYELSKLEGLGDRARGHIDSVIDKNGEWVDANADHSYDALFGKLRGTFPGNWWHSITLPEQQKKALNLAINPTTGNYEELLDTTGYVMDGDALNYTDTDDALTTLNYWKKAGDTSAAGDGAGKTGNNEEADTDRKIPYKDDRLKYAGIFGPAIGLGLWAAGVGKPDTGELDASMNYARNATGRATYRPIGNYIKLDDMDIWEQQNRMDANTNATNRAIMNTGSTAGGKMAGLLSSGYNSQLGSADLYKKAIENHNTNVLKEGEFNRGTDMFNAEAFNKTSQVNAELENKNAQFQANLAADIARQKMAARAQWYQGLYGNIGNLATSLANVGRENAQHNMLAALANNGVFGTTGSEAGHYSGTKKDLIEEANRKVGKSSTSASHGGKLKRRRGFTI